MNEPFEDVYVVTLKTQLAENMKLYPKSAIVAGREYVQVDKDGIAVCINADTTEDADVMSRALDMVADALDKLNGELGQITFGDPIVFKLEELQVFMQ